MATRGADEEPRERTQGRTRSSSQTAEGEKTARRPTRTGSTGSTASTSKTEPTGTTGTPARQRSTSRTSAPKDRTSGDTGRKSTETGAEETGTPEVASQETPARRLPASKAARLAMQQVMQLAGRDPESVTSLERGEQGWHVGVEVVETHRIPDSADILAVYDTELDEDGELLSYRRTQRYPRGHSQE